MSISDCLELFKLCFLNKAFPGNDALNQLVALDQTGEPLHTLVRTSNLPNVDFSVLNELLALLKNAIDEYYHRNSIRGCTDPTAPNFSYQVSSV